MSHLSSKGDSSFGPLLPRKGRHAKKIDLTLFPVKAFENAKWDLRAESRTYASRILFGITIPGPVNKDVELVRKAFVATGISFSTTDVPPPDMTIAGPGTTPVMVMIGSKPPPF